ncbi:hypothetical protein [Amycolatopsis sp. DSM 110486]|uniref:hypothetical protein n=1 Tax=Amycolatopsis sp. DSM 110486 TaxID=2865832 RepID=UPI0021073C4A|nr:hypothetical protein [Amycolatopsis sp. DSM 110486]
MLVAVRFPLPRAGEGFGFAEVARRHGDLALAGVAIRVRVSGGQVEEAVLTAFGVSDRAVTRDVTAMVCEAGGDADALADPVAAPAGELVDTAGDSHGSPAHRRRLRSALGARGPAHAYRFATRGKR